MEKYVLVPTDTMTYAKYLSYKTGKFYKKANNANNVNNDLQCQDRPLINDHFLYANRGHDTDNNNISHIKNKEYYSNLFENENFLIVDNFSYTFLEELFENVDKHVIVIPGIKMVDNVNNSTQYEIYNHYDKKIVIQKATYTEFIKYIGKMPGTLPQKVNYVESFNFNVDNEANNEKQYRIQYIKNIYTEEMNRDYKPCNIEDFYNKLDRNFYGVIDIDLFVSHQSKDKVPYIDDYIYNYRILNPQKLVWYDKDFFQTNIASNSAYARNTIAHGLMNAKKIEIVMSNNYFDRLLKSINESADYFGINYELALIANLNNLSDSKIKKGKIYLYEFNFDGLILDSKIFNFPKYTEINSYLKLEDINKEQIKSTLMADLEADDIELKELKYLYKDLN